MRIFAVLGLGLAMSASGLAAELPTCSVNGLYKDFEVGAEYKRYEANGPTESLMTCTNRAVRIDHEMKAHKDRSYSLIFDYAEGSYEEKNRTVVSGKLSSSTETPGRCLLKQSVAARGVLFFFNTADIDGQATSLQDCFEQAKNRLGQDIEYLSDDPVLPGLYKHKGWISSVEMIYFDGQVEFDAKVSPDLPTTVPTYFPML